MSLDHYVNHNSLVSFAETKVNLASTDVKKYREQVRDLRDRLATYINAHPSFSLVKMLHAGSVAKGTALSKVNDMDVAVYVRNDASPADEKQLLTWMRDRLIEAYGGWKKAEDFTLQHHCVTVAFHGSGLDVDVVPVLFEGDADDQGYLITKDAGDRVLTSIPRHLEFIRKHKDGHDPDYRQLIRFVKWWKRHQPGDFRFKSFMIELIVAKLFDEGKITKGNYLEALTEFFTYIVTSKLRESIVFADYYSTTDVKNDGKPIQIFDPVNPKNNVSRSYSEADRNNIVTAAADALDTLTYARRCTTKQECETVLKEIFGPSFKV